MAELMKDFVLGLFDDNVEPDAKIRRHHVHQPEISYSSWFAIDRHLSYIKINKKTSF